MPACLINTVAAFRAAGRRSVFSRRSSRSPRWPPSTSKARLKRGGCRHTAWGDPDLQGTWNFANLTPLERPRELAGKTVLTEKEAEIVRFTHISAVFIKNFA